MTVCMQSNHVNPLIGAQFQSHINIFHLIMRAKEDWQLEMRFKTASILNRKKTYGNTEGSQRPALPGLGLLLNSRLFKYYAFKCQ